MYIIHKYLTLWIFVLVIFHNTSSNFFSLPYLTFMILFNGLYLSYINPRKYYIEYYDDNNEKSIIIIDGIKKNIADIFFHIIPFIYIYNIYGFESFFTNWKIIPSLLLIFIYLLIYNPTTIYYISINEVIILSFSTVLLYNILYLYC